MTHKDFGNLHPSTSVSHMVNASTLNLYGGGGGNYSLTTNIGTAVPNIYSTTYTNYNPPNMSDWLTMPGIIDTIIETLTTRVKPNEKLVVCVDDDMSWEQVKEIQTGLNTNKLTGIVIRGARAGTGFKGDYLPPTAEEARVDVLARIGEIWALDPKLRLTDLLQWYDGQDMSDEEFATSVEIHFMKVTNGVRGKP